MRYLSSTEWSWIIKHSTRGACFGRVVIVRWLFIPVPVNYVSFVSMGLQPVSRESENSVAAMLVEQTK